MRAWYFRSGLVTLGCLAGVVSAQGPSYPPLPPLQPVAPPPAQVVPAAGQIPPVTSLPTPPAAVPVSGDIPVISGPPAAPTTPTLTPMPPATPPAPVSAVAAAPKAESRISVILAAAPGDTSAKYETAIAEAKAAYVKVRDYSCHMKKTERINGKLSPEQTAEFHARAKPASVYLKYISPREMVGMEACFVDGKFPANAKVRFKPAGVLGVAGYQTLPMDDAKIMSTHRQTVDHLGIGEVIERMEKTIQIEKRLGNAVAVSVAEYTFADRPVTRYEVVCGTPHAYRTCYRTVVCVDKETKLPVRLEAYDAPKAGGDPAGDLLECYSYVNLKLNPGHGAGVFDR